VSAAVSTTGLAPNTYNATITITATGATNTPQTVAVTLTVPSPTINFSPSSLTFTGVNPPAQTVNITNSGGGTLNWTATSNQPWLTLTPSANSVSATVSTAGLAPNTYNATITIVAAGATNTPQTIPVTLTVPSPTINFSPASLTFTGTQGGANPAAQVLSITNSGGGTLTWTASSNQPWLTLTPSANSVSAAVSLSGLTPNTYNATITITATGATNTPQTVAVTLTVSAAPPTINFSPSSLTFTGTQGGADPAAQLLSITNSGGGTLTWTATSNQPWLVLTPSANSVSAAVSLTGLAPNTYNATITIAATGATNTPQTVLVTLTVNAAPPTINLSPGSLTFTGANPAAQTVNVTNSGGGTLNWTATSNQPWLTLTPSPNSVSAAVYTAGLAPNTYNATITIAATGATNTPQTIPVTLTVPSPTINFSPATLTFTGVNPVAQTVNITNSGGGTLNWTATSNQPWLTLTPSANSVSAAVSTAGLAPNTYNATITITATGATNTPQTIPVTLTVPAPTINFSPSSLTFTGTQGSANPAAQVLNITNSGGGTLTWTATSNQPWLTLTPSANSVSAAVSLTGLAPNTYNATITISATGATNTPQTVPVTLTVNAAVPTISFSPAGLSFAATQGGANPAAQVLSITNTGGGTLNWTATSNQAWLALTPSANSVSAAISLAGLAPGVYNATITIAATGATNTPQTVPVSLTLSTAAPTLTASPTSITQTSTANGPLASSLPVTVSNTGASAITWSVSANQPWVNLSPLTGTASVSSTGAFVVRSNPTGLAVGTYNATVTVSAPGLPSQTIPVTFNVLTQPTLTVSPSALTFSASAGGTTPPAQPLYVVNGGGGVLTWTASADAAWIGLTINSGGMFVQPNLTGLASGTYTGNITITATGAAGSPQTVPVTLNLAAATPSAISSSPASLTFNHYVGGARPTARLLSLTNLGNGSIPWTASSNQTWLSAGQPSGSTSALLPISVQPNGLAAGTYTGAITLSSTAGSGSTATVPVTLNVIDPTPLRNRYAAPNGSPTGDGSINNPWDLYTALFYNYALQPGDTLWLRGGVYTGPGGYFNCVLNGTPARPVIVRQYPGERAIIEGGVYLYGAYTWFWGFEIRGLATSNRTLQNTMSFGLEVYAPGAKVINMTIHDGYTGLSLWRQATDAEAYGNTVYNFGYQGTDRGHGHAIYTQNDTGLKTIHDNILFHGFGFGLHAYGTDASAVRNYDAEGNISFNNGVLGIGRPHSDNIFFSGGISMQGIRVENNYTYHTIADGQGTNQFGFGGGGPHADLVARGNYFIGGSPSIYFNNWQDIDFRNNVVYDSDGWMLSLTTEQGQLPQRYLWDFNSYYSNAASPFRLFAPRWTFDAWKLLTNADAGSTVNPARPAGATVFVRPNKFELGRGHVAVYNWALTPTVSVDLSSILSPGNNYEIRNAVNPTAAPILTGTYSGGLVSLPMTGLTAATPLGTAVPTQPVHPGPEFGVFQVIKTP
ncbi:MAG: BACON domain-containing carbohydrate-binding protein, partial [Bryobacteraceae bacterium]